MCAAKVEAAAEMERLRQTPLSGGGFKRPAQSVVARLGPEAVWGRMEMRLEGLSEAEAEKRGKAYGPNVVAEGKRRGWPWRLIKALRNP